MIQPSYFYDLLDCLAGQFFTSKYAQCIGNDFGVSISLNAKEYFSVVIIPEKLENDLVVLGVLLDDSYHIASRNGFTFVIYIDIDKIAEKSNNNDFIKIIEIIIFGHEICHFTTYYELFLKMGDNTGIETHSNFKHEVSVTMMSAITEETDPTKQNIFDEHNITDLIRNMRRFPNKHFTKGKASKIDYIKFFDKFLDHLHFDDLADNL